MKVYEIFYKNKLLFILYFLIVCFASASYIGCFDALTWYLEVLPVYIGVIVIFYLYNKNVNISDILNFFIMVQMIILIVGGHYSYAKVPLFEYAKDWFGWSRNNYDKVGHFVQGITPFLIMKELLVKKYKFKNTFMLNFICISVSLAFSALYELIEFLSAVILGQGAEEFLGTQGDIWDTQKDMLFALIGAIFISIMTLNYGYK